MRQMPIFTAIGRVYLPVWSRKIRGLVELFARLVKGVFRVFFAPLHRLASSCRRTASTALDRLRRLAHFHCHDRNTAPGKKRVLRPKRKTTHAAALLTRAGKSPAEIWSALDISRQGAMDLLHPLINAGIVEKLGGKKPDVTVYVNNN